MNKKDNFGVEFSDGMTNILFIYGYGGSPESTFCKLIREALPVEHYNRYKVQTDL